MHELKEIVSHSEHQVLLRLHHRTKNSEANDI